MTHKSFVGGFFTDKRHHQTSHDMSLIEEELAVELCVYGYLS